jgi:hypothetical protein
MAVAFMTRIIRYLDAGSNGIVSLPRAGRTGGRASDLPWVLRAGLRLSPGPSPIGRFRRVYVVVTCGEKRKSWAGLARPLHWEKADAPGQARSARFTLAFLETSQMAKKGAKGGKAKGKKTGGAAPKAKALPKR